MFLHNQKMMFSVRLDEPNPEFAKLLLEQFGGPNGELAAASATSRRAGQKAM